MNQEWKADATWLASELGRAHQSLLDAAAGAENLPRRPGLNPVSWTLGHVAFMMDFIVAYPLQLPTPGGVRVPSKSPRLPVEVATTDDEVIADTGIPAMPAPTPPWFSRHSSMATVFLPRDQTWTIYDPSRVTNDERWDRFRDGTLPDAKEYLDQAVATAIDLTQTSGLFLDEVESHLVLYGLIHMLWHEEDLLHTRNVHGLPAPAPLTPLFAERNINALPADATEKLATQTTSDSLWHPGGDVRLPGGTYYLGTEREMSRKAPLVLDCEK